ncbi:hypothetical protein K439DRAFT_1614519 [Ramaria rubella]|nr:hypothetical protein K439DRAFT_1614519 [Ramaria rubella]
MLEYPPGAYEEYPQTDAKFCIAHVFTVDADPKKFYGLGAPMGQHYQWECDLLKDSTGSLIKCKETSLTCQGSKICSHAHPSLCSMTYSSPSREDIKLALHNDISVVPISARAVVLKKTLTLRVALDREGCPCPLDKSTALFSEEYAHAESRREFLDKAMRGHCSPEASCKGQLVFGRHKDGHAYVKCEHYGLHNHPHLIDHRVQETDEEYMEALFDNDQDEVARIEQAATAEGRGPLLPCHTVANSTSMWPFCCM